MPACWLVCLRKPAAWRAGPRRNDENYFEPGAHSLMLVRAHEQISTTIKPDLPIVALSQYPTVRDLAAHLTMGAGPGRRNREIRARAQNQQRAVERRKAQAELTNVGTSASLDPG